NVARLNSDGTLDTSFQTGAGADGEVFALKLDAQSRILLGGAFQAVDSHAHAGLARLNNDGSLDNNFAPQFSFASGAGPAPLHTIVLQADSKILAGGVFNQVNGIP